MVAEQGIPDREKSLGTEQRHQSTVTLDGTFPGLPGMQREAGGARSRLEQQDKMTRDIECHSRTQGSLVAEE